MVKVEYLNIELIQPHGWTHAPSSGSFTVELEAVCPGTDNLILAIPLHEDFFDMCKAYCEQYKEHIQEKIK